MKIRSRWIFALLNKSANQFGMISDNPLEQLDGFFFFWNIISRISAQKSKSELKIIFSRGWFQKYNIFNKKPVTNKLMLIIKV